MSMRNQNSELRIKNFLKIEADGAYAVVEHGGRKARVLLRVRPLLRGVERVVHDPRQIEAIAVRLQEVTFSTARMVTAVVNTLAWQLGVKVNGKRRMPAQYSREPNITYGSKTTALKNLR